MTAGALAGIDPVGMKRTAEETVGAITIILEGGLAPTEARALVLVAVEDLIVTGLVDSVLTEEVRNYIFLLQSFTL